MELSLKDLGRLDLGRCTIGYNRYFPYNHCMLVRLTSQIIHVEVKKMVVHRVPESMGFGNMFNYGRTGCNSINTKFMVYSRTGACSLGTHVLPCRDSTASSALTIPTLRRLRHQQHHYCHHYNHHHHTSDTCEMGPHPGDTTPASKSNHGVQRITART